MLLRELDVPFDPSADFARLFAAYHTGFLFESAEGPKRLARYSIMGVDPAGTVRLDADGALSAHGDLPPPKPAELPVDYLRRLMRAHLTTDQGYRYLGGLVGHTSYENIGQLERLEARPDADWPLFEYGLYLDGLVFDNLTRRVIYFSHAQDRSAQFEALIRGAPADPEAPRFGAPTTLVDDPRYRAWVEQAQQAIHDGEIFQVVLARAFEMSLHGSLLPYYEALKRANPSPYMFYLQNGARRIVGASPEMLVRIDGGRVETFPIAGTRPLGADAAEETRLREELLADAKEAAEHAMLVDLARNDVGRVAEYGTVQVSENRKVERFSHVQHLVSKVEGRLRPGHDAFDAFHAVFPAGTVSGAPKVRAMELIRSLEPHARGPYAGAVGYFSFNGNADAAITIRTLYADAETARVMAGAGIVQDSKPQAEADETRAKAQGLLAVAAMFPANAAKYDDKIGGASP